VPPSSNRDVLRTRLCSAPRSGCQRPPWETLLAVCPETHRSLVFSLSVLFAADTTIVEQSEHVLSRTRTKLPGLVHFTRHVELGDGPAEIGGVGPLNPRVTPIPRPSYSILTASSPTSPTLPPISPITVLPRPLSSPVRSAEDPHVWPERVYKNVRAIAFLRPAPVPLFLPPIECRQPDNHHLEGVWPPS